MGVTQGVCVLLLRVRLPTVPLGGVPWGPQKHPACLLTPHPVFTMAVCTPWLASAPSFPTALRCIRRRVWGQALLAAEPCGQDTLLPVTPLISLP